MPEVSPDDELLVHQLAQAFSTVESPDPRWFERLYFNCHDDGGLLVLAGFGVFPNAGVADGYFVVADGVSQRNVRVSRDLGSSRLATAAGPLILTLEEPLARWRLQLAETEGVSADLTFFRRTDPYSVGMIHFPKEDGPDTAFQHYYQSGRYTGFLTVDGHAHAVDGWLGHRDHSWGLRRPRERLGVHFWLCGQFAECCLTVSYNEGRDGLAVFSEGAVLYEGAVEPFRVERFFHRLRLADDGVRVVAGEFVVELEDGQSREFTFEPTMPDVWVAGAGYGGWQGQDRGALHVESETWDQTDTERIKDLPLGTSDQLGRFTMGSMAGFGVLEVGVSRSRNYTYRPSW